MTSMTGIGEIRELIIHHSASPTTTSWADVREWHRAKGWPDVGYHRGIVLTGDSSGTATPLAAVGRLPTLVHGRNFGHRGAHAPPNAGRHGICVMGDNTVPEHNWTTGQWFLLADFVNDWIEMFDGFVMGHNLTKSTACPGLTPKQLKDGLIECGVARARARHILTEYPR